MSDLRGILQGNARRWLRKQPQPRWISPMLATLSERHFSDAAWIFERKFDGVRCLAFRGAETGTRLMSRNQQNINRTFPELVEAIERQPCGDFVVDGEIVAFDGTATSFGLLQKRLGIVDPQRARSRNVPVFLYFFDILHVDGCDVTRVPLIERKNILKQVIDFRANRNVRYSEHRREHGQRFFEQACRDGWEGLIAKRADSPYMQGRSRDWLKLKCISEEEFVVGGYTDPQRSRTGFGALLVGYYDRGGRLHYAGKVGTGYDEQTLRLLGDHLRKIERAEPPFNESEIAADRGARDAHWIVPNLVAQVSFSEWTRDGRLRHPRFLGLRSDKPPEQVVREMPWQVTEG